MMEFAALALEHVAVAVFHAVVHIAGHESFETAKLRLHKRILRNHDLTLAMRESFLAAVNILEGTKSKSNSTELTKLFDVGPEVRAAFSRLRAEVDLLFPISEAPHSQDADEVIDLATAANARDRLTIAVLDRFRDAPSEFRDRVRDHFSDAFQFAFVEIGLKHNEAVRSLITFELLTSLAESSKRSEAELNHVGALLQSAIESIERQEQFYTSQRSFHQTATEMLNEILSGVADVVDLQHQLITVSQNVGRRNAARKPIAHIVISDDQGCRLAQGPIHTSLITLGRDPSNTVCLPHRLVSRQHATVRIEQGLLTIKEVQTVNGTSVNGDRLLGCRSIDFGDQIRIGPFVVEFRRKDQLYGTRPISTVPME
jgi:hypothetical protein